MPDPPKWKIDRKQIRHPDPRMLGGRGIDGKPMKHIDKLFGPKKRR